MKIIVGVSMNGIEVGIKLDLLRSLVLVIIAMGPASSGMAISIVAMDMHDPKILLLSIVYCTTTRQTQFE